MGKVLGIFIARETAGPMESVKHAALVAGHGIAEDRYAEGGGTFSRLKDAAVPKVRHITFFSREALNEGNRGLARRGLTLAPYELRRNVFVEGLDLNSLVEKPFGNEKLRFEGFELAKPCKLPIMRLTRIDRRTDKLELVQAFKEHFALGGGIRAAVYTDGLISVDDELWPL